MSEQIYGEELLRNLELAADVFSSPSSSNEQRKEAEQYFLNLRNAKLNFDVSRFIFERSTKEFVLFQIVSSWKETVIREWSFLPESLIRSICEYLLTFVTRPGLSSSVIAESLQTVGVIAKRGTFDKKSVDAGRLFDLAAEWIASGDATLQSLACQLLLSVCNEYGTSWRSKTANLTWDFHVRAKRTFEENGLRRVFQLCLQVLHHLLNNAPSLCDRNHAYSDLSAKLLFVAEAVLNWNFGSKLLPKRITCTVEFSPAVCFKPGEGWREVLLNADVLHFFFEMYAKVKMNEDLGHRVLQCLIPLSSLTGSIFANDDAKRPYLHRFVGCLTEKIRESSGSVHPVTLSQIMLKLSSFFAPNLFFALPESVLFEYLSWLTQLTRHYGTEAVRESVDECESTFQEAYENLLTVWANFVNSSEPVTCLDGPCREVFASYVHTHLAPPIGNRPLAIATDETEISEVAEDDRDRYAEVLKIIGKLGRWNVAVAGQRLFDLMKERVDAFCRYLKQLDSQHNSMAISNDKAGLASYHEDMHWLLLLCGAFLVLEDDRGIKIPPEIYVYSTNNGVSLSSTDFTTIGHYVDACIASPMEDVSCPQLDNDPVMRLIVVVLRWAAVEHQRLGASGGDLLSPQVAQTTLWCLRRLVMAYNASRTDGDYKGTPISKQLDAGILSKSLTNFVLQKALKSLVTWGGETFVAKDAVALVTSLAQIQTRANEVADSAKLFFEVQKANIQQMSPLTRCGLLQCLVAIGTATDLISVQQELCIAVLEPLSASFNELKLSLENSTRITSVNQNETHIPQLLDCFNGIGQCLSPRSTRIIFGYLSPVLDISPKLLHQFKDVAPVWDSLLEFYQDLTRKLDVVSEHLDLYSQFLSHLLRFFDAYSANINGRFQSGGVMMEEETMEHLRILLSIATNVVSNSNTNPANWASETDLPSLGGAVACRAIELVTGQVTKRLMQYPTVSGQYFKAVASLAEGCPMRFCQMNVKTLNDIFSYIMWSLSGEYGNEATKGALDTLNALSTFVCQSIQEYCDHMRNFLWHFIKPVFERCLETCSEADQLTDAATSLYSLICCGQAQYRTMVRELILSHTDPLVQQKLVNAFQSLLADNATLQPFRRDKRAFRDRFEAFLNDVQGLMCVNW